jgi:hypothetical protein
VWTRGIKATCGSPLTPPEAPGAPWANLVSTPQADRPCTYVYSPAMAASLSSISTLVVTTGVALNVTGTGFATRPFVQLVRVGSPGSTVDCAVGIFKATSLLCTVGPGPSGQYTLRVVVGEWAVG